MSYHLLRESNVKTRKAHICEWCGEAIEKGDQAVSTAGVFYGDFQSNYFHPECAVALDAYFKNNPGEEAFDPRQNERGKFEIIEPICVGYNYSKLTTFV